MIIRHFIYDAVVNGIASSYFCPNRIRTLIYRLWGHKIYGGLMSGCFLGAGKGRLSIGHGSYINYRCFLDLGDNITIGDNCSIAFNVTFINSTHELGPKERRAWEVKSHPIIVGNGVWIGANVTIMPGVTIGNGCVVGSGSLVVKDCEPNSMYYGSPAKKIKEMQ